MHRLCQALTEIEIEVITRDEMDAAAAEAAIYAAQHYDLMATDYAFLPPRK